MKETLRWIDRSARIKRKTQKESDFFLCVQVASLARFDEEPRDVIIRVGDTARFNCYAALPASLASLAPPPSVHVSWLKDDQPLPLDASRMLQLESGALEIDDVGLADQVLFSRRSPFRASPSKPLSHLD